MLITCRRHEGFFSRIHKIDNLHSWSRGSPHKIRNSRFQHNFAMNLWAGIVGGIFIRPYELHEIMNAARYLQFLENYLGPLVDDVSLEVRQNMWLQLYRAPAHYAYNGRWIEWGEIIPWPPPSQDLNPLYVFLWCYHKEIVYRGKSQLEQELRRKLQAAKLQIKTILAYCKTLEEVFLEETSYVLETKGNNLNIYCRIFRVMTRFVLITVVSTDFCIMFILVLNAICIHQWMNSY